MDWLAGLTENIDQLNRNIQHNVQQLNQQVQETVQSNLAQVHRATENLDRELGKRSVSYVSPAHGPPIFSIGTDFSSPSQNP